MRTKLLIVDDEEGITRSLVRYFELNEFDVAATNDPLIGLKMVEEENYQIVISDIMMPGMDGMEFLSKIKAFNGGIQVIMITGVVSIDNVLTCLRRGANYCFLKPLDDLESLKNAVDDCAATLVRWEELIRSMVKRKKR